MTTIVTTCKGRLTELTEAVVSWLFATPCPILIVNDGCPELAIATEWNSRVTVIATGAALTDDFSKPRALNLGGRTATTEHLLFLDSDTLVSAEFWPWYAPRTTPDALFIVPPSPERRDLTGVLGVAQREYQTVGGADEGMIGWGSEDLDLRLRLFLERKLRIIDIPPHLLSSIPHDDARRTRYYSEKDKMASHRRNIQRLVDNAERISGQSVWSLLCDPNVQRLLGGGLGAEPGDR